jgi:hypothetical protein
MRSERRRPGVAVRIIGGVSATAACLRILYLTLGQPTVRDQLLDILAIKDVTAAYPCILIGRSESQSE